MSDLTRDEVLAAVHPIATTPQSLKFHRNWRRSTMNCCSLPFPYYGPGTAAAKAPEDVPRRPRPAGSWSILGRSESEVKESWLGEFRLDFAIGDGAAVSTCQFRQRLTLGRGRAIVCRRLSKSRK